MQIHLDESSAEHQTIFVQETTTTQAKDTKVHAHASREVVG